MAAAALLHHTGVFLPFALKCLVEGGGGDKTNTAQFFFIYFAIGIGLLKIS